MSLESLFLWFAAHRSDVFVAILLAPALTWLLCQLIPGRREEPLLLSINLWLAVVTLLMWVGYLAYASNTGGWELVVKQADVLLLLAPPYYVIASLLMSRQRMPLHYIPAFRTLQGLVIMGAVYFAIAALFSRIRIYIFSYLPFSTGLWILAILLGIGYWGYRRMVDGLPNPQAGSRSPRQSRPLRNAGQSHPAATHGSHNIDDELEQLRQDLNHRRKS